jgi:NDP-sugar pyrophosphorylase family protein
MEAVLLAAGRGTRMRGLCAGRPKPMLPVAGRAMLEVTVDHLAHAGIDRVFVVVGYLAEQIRHHFERSRPPVPVEFIIQEEARGTGQAALLGRGPMREAPFLLAFADIFVSGRNYRDIFERFDPSEADMLLTTHWVEDPCRGAAVYVDDRSHVTRIVEKPEPGTSETHFDNAGLFCFTPDIWDRLEKVEPSPRGEYELTDAIAATVRDGRVLAHELTGYWLNLTGPEELLEANRLLLDETAEQGASEADAGLRVVVDASADVAPRELGPYVSIGAGCRIEEGAAVENAILLPGARVGRDARVEYAVLGDGVEVADGASVVGTRQETAVLLPE